MWFKTQWQREKGQTIQWQREKGQTIQWQREKGQTTQWQREKEQTTIYKLHIKHKDRVTRTPLKPGVNSVKGKQFLLH